MIDEQFSHKQKLLDIIQGKSRQTGTTLGLMTMQSSEGGPFESVMLDEDLDLPEDNDLSKQMVVMNYLEDKYVSMKIIMNTCDCQTQEMHLKIQNLITCQKMIVGKMESDKMPNPHQPQLIQFNQFDLELKEANQQLQQLLSHLTTQRAQFLSLHDQFINKQVLIFQLTQLEDFKRKQINLEAPIENANALMKDHLKKNDQINVQFFEAVVNCQKEKMVEIQGLADKVKVKLDENEDTIVRLKEVYRDISAQMSSKTGTFASMDYQQKERING